MAAATSILPEKLHEYPQQDVIDGSGGESASILEECLEQHGGVLQLCSVMPAEPFVAPVNAFDLMRVPIIRITWVVPVLMKSGWDVPYPL